MVGHPRVLLVGDGQHEEEQNGRASRLVPEAHGRGDSALRVGGVDAPGAVVLGQRAVLAGVEGVHEGRAREAAQILG